MSLFIGRLNPNVHRSDLEDMFEKFGKLERCDLKNTFAFVTFQDERDAEDALDDLQDREIIPGVRMNIEWAKQSGRYRESSSRRREPKCFKCGKYGHYERDCSRGRNRGRSRSYSRSRSRSRSRDRKRRSRSRSNTRNESRSPPRRHHSKSPSPKRSISPKRSRSKSPKRSRSPSGK